MHGNLNLNKVQAKKTILNFRMVFFILKVLIKPLQREFPLQL